jgi:hypothetical protein
MNRKLGIIVGILTVLGIIWGVANFIDNRYAKAGEQKAVERRLDLKIEGDILNTKQTRLWALQDRYGMDVSKVPVPAIRQQMKELEATIPMQADKVKALEAK